MSDPRLPDLPDGGLPQWRSNPAYADLGLSPESVAALDESEQQEALMRDRLRERTEANRIAIEQGNAALAARHAEQQRTDQLSDGELRQQLSAAIDQVAIAQRQAATADTTLERARQGVATAETRLARFADLDARVAAYRTEQIKNDGVAALPVDLMTARSEQREAQELLEATQRAFVNLASELQTAQLHAEEMAQARDAAAVAVISRHCDNLATEIETAQQHLHDLRQQVLSISGLWVPLAGASAALPVSDRVRAALRRGDDRRLVSEEIKSLAQEFFVRLQTDAQATIGE